MRHTFADALHYQMTLNNNIVLISCDMGHHMWDRIKKDYPKRFFNVGASEQAGMDIAVGMAYDGKIPVVYSITPFLILRAFETIRTYIDYEELKVILAGSGREDDYKHDGISHDASDIDFFLDGVRNINTYYPQVKEDVPGMLKECLETELPSFISLRRI